MGKTRRSTKSTLIGVGLIALALLMLGPPSTDEASVSTRSFIVKASSVEEAQQAVQEAGAQASRRLGFT